MEIECVSLDKTLLPDFDKLLLPQASALLWEGNAETMAVGALYEGIPCGAAAVCYGETDAELISIFVADGLRRKGVASLLLLLLLDDCRAKGYGSISANFALPEAELNEMSSFLMENGFAEQTTVSHIYKMQMAQLCKHPIITPALKAGFRPAEQILPISGLDDFRLFELNRDKWIPDFLRPNRFQDTLEELSLCYLDKGKVVSYLICSQGWEGNSIIISSAVTKPEAPTGAFAKLIQSVAAKVYKAFGNELTVYVSAINHSSASLCEKLSQGQFETLEEKTAFFLFGAEKEPSADAEM